jgi:SNF2 family DNA or RNA helicase
MLVSKQFNKLYVPAEHFKTVPHKLFTDKQMIKVKDKYFIVLPFDDTTSTIFIRHGVDAPAPIEHYYGWPARYKPFKHQIATAKFFVAHRRAMCCNDIGTGKTLATLWAADYLMSKGIYKSVLIITPLSTTSLVWGDAIFESFPHRTFQILTGAAPARREKLAKKADFYIINHDGLKVIEHALSERSDIGLVIVDEMAVYRNHSTDRYKTLLNLYGPETGVGMWGLTGAPMPHAPTDIWAQMRMINPTAVPRSFTRFRDEVMYKVTNFKWVPKRDWETRCQEVMKPCIRFTQAQCLDLPPVSYISHQAEKSPEQAKAYKQMMQECIADAAGGTIKAINEAVKLTKLLQIATGVVYGIDGSVLNLSPSPKIAALKELVELSNNKILIFTPFKNSVSMLYKELSKSFSVKAVTGDTPVSQRNETFTEFQQGDLQIVVAHPKCIAHGITLTASSMVVWFAPIDDYEIYQQANGRISRAGQTKCQTVVHLECSEIERRVYERLKTKGSMQGVLLELLKKES